MLKINEDIYGCLCKCCHTRLNNLCDHLVDKEPHSTDFKLEISATKSNTTMDATIHSSPDFPSVDRKIQPETSDKVP